LTTESREAARPEAAKDQLDAAKLRLGLIFLRISRLVTAVGVVALLLAAWSLILVVGYETLRHLGSLAGVGAPVPDTKATLVASIKLIDIVLIATVLQVTAFGLYSLMVDPGLPLPRWLRVDDPEELKRKLAGILVIMLGVLFLEETIEWRTERNLLPFGLAIAVMIAALSFFTRGKADRP
jgi:uncharacterized membrane protein YqhA